VAADPDDGAILPEHGLDDELLTELRTRCGGGVHQYRVQCMAPRAEGEVAAS
jgi:hypothetical protein